jgi:hypothetical protein
LTFAEISSRETVPDDFLHSRETRQMMFYIPRRMVGDDLSFPF